VAAATSMVRNESGDDGRLDERDNLLLLMRDRMPAD
jgi:hypothetical protein